MSNLVITKKYVRVGTISLENNSLIIPVELVADLAFPDGSPAGSKVAPSKKVIPIPHYAPAEAASVAASIVSANSKLLTPAHAPLITTLLARQAPAKPPREAIACANARLSDMLSGFYSPDTLVSAGTSFADLVSTTAGAIAVVHESDQVTLNVVLRCMREQGRQSPPFLTAAVRGLRAIAEYSPLHQYLVEAGVHAEITRTLVFEIERHKVRMNELAASLRAGKTGAAGATASVWSVQDVIMENCIIILHLISSCSPNFAQYLTTTPVVYKVLLSVIARFGAAGTVGTTTCTAATGAAMHLLTQLVQTQPPAAPQALVERVMRCCELTMGLAAPALGLLLGLAGRGDGAVASVAVCDFCCAVLQSGVVDSLDSAVRLLGVCAASPEVLAYVASSTDVFSVLLGALANPNLVPISRSILSQILIHSFTASTKSSIEFISHPAFLTFWSDCPKNVHVAALVAAVCTKQPALALARLVLSNRTYKTLTSGTSTRIFTVGWGSELRDSDRADLHYNLIAQAATAVATSENAPFIYVFAPALRALAVAAVSELGHLPQEFMAGTLMRSLSELVPLDEAVLTPEYPHLTACLSAIGLMATLCELDAPAAAAKLGCTWGEGEGTEGDTEIARLGISVLGLAASMRVLPAVQTECVRFVGAIAVLPVVRHRMMSDPAFSDILLLCSALTDAGVRAAAHRLVSGMLRLEPGEPGRALAGTCIKAWNWKWCQSR